MFDLNWIFATDAGHPASVLSKSRADFGVEMDSGSPHFCRAVNATVGTLHNAAANDTRPSEGREAAASPKATLRRVIGLLRRRLDRAHSHQRRFELDDHILKDIGLTREALLLKATTPDRW